MFEIHYRTPKNKKAIILYPKSQKEIEKMLCRLVYRRIDSVLYVATQGTRQCGGTRAVNPTDSTGKYTWWYKETGRYLPNGASRKAGINESILDAGWIMLVEMCSYKAASAGRTLLQINPRYTSQTCSGCGQRRKKTLEERWHSCSCGCELDRDHNAAINILRAGRVLQEQSCQSFCA